MNKKIKSIISENILYAFRENVLLGPIAVFVLLLVVYGVFGDSFILTDFKESTYISIMGNIQYILGLLVLIFLAISSFDKDFKSKNIYIILQQVTKQEYFIGKILSIIILTGLLNMAFMILFSIGYIVMFKAVDLSLSYIFLFQQLEFIVLTVLVALVSFIISKNVGRIMFVGMFMIVGHTLPTLKQLIDKGILEVGKLSEKIIDIFYYILPNLSLLNVKDIILFDNVLGITLLKATIYSLGLVYILYIISMFFFKKKDF